MRIVKIRDVKYNADKLTYEDYLSLVPKGNKKHYETLTGNTIEPKKVLKEIPEQEILEDLDNVTNNDVIEEKVTKEDKRKSNVK